MIRKKFFPILTSPNNKSSFEKDGMAWNQIGFCEFRQNLITDASAEKSLLHNRAVVT
jgi:hypothetical protein